MDWKPASVVAASTIMALTVSNGARSGNAAGNGGGTFNDRLSFFSSAWSGRSYP